MPPPFPPAALEGGVSVVMPSFSQGRFIRAAALSVLEQDVPGGLELVVVDGGSTDETLGHLVELSIQYPGRLRWYSAPDSGPAQAVNRAVELCRAPLIGWLNSDDLYAPAAVGRAAGYFAAHPDMVMVYGDGEHIDEIGASLGRYPALPPSTPVGAFADGCFICQPTVFFRRETFRALGGLDESLGASFDFDLWVRYFITFPGRVGWMPALQAYSRLHAGGITLRQREQVALEGLTVVGRHLGPPPAHWLLTHFAELAARHPFDGQVRDLRERIEAIIGKARRLVGPLVLDDWYRHLANDRNLLLSTPWFLATVYPDGWAGPVLDLRLRQPKQPFGSIELSCRHAAPEGGLLRLTVFSPGTAGREMIVEGVGPFQIVVDLEDLRPDARIVIRISSAESFVPAEQTGSDDLRSLSFLVEEAACLRKT